MSLKDPREITLRALIINNKNKILTCYYKKYNTFMCPGGHLDEGETYEEALKRELYEECGSTEVDIKKHLLDLYTYKDDTLSKYYLVDINKIDLKHRNLEAGEVSDGLTLKWASIEDIINVNTKQYYNSLRDEKGKPYLIKRELEFYKEVWEKYL